MKKIYVLGGGTQYDVRNHLALCAPAYGTTAKTIASLCEERFENMEIFTVLTKMADPASEIVTNEDVSDFVEKIVSDFDTKIIFFSVAMCDFIASVEDASGNLTTSGKYETRLESSMPQRIFLQASRKVISEIRKKRKDIFLVGFKTTCNASIEEQYIKGLNLLKKASCNLVLANDTGTRLNMIITPEESKYSVTVDRNEALKELVNIAYFRSHLSFTRSTVVEGVPVGWDSEKVYPSLREIVNYCISKNAYKPFNGSTVGHFACKIGEREFLTSIRKSNFNDIQKNGLVRVVVDRDDTVIAYGAKPSVGGQSQRIIFSEHNDYDCIVHFHCPMKQGSDVPVVSQREYECGSHECGQNTSNGLKRFGNLSAVMLDNHGPNIVFHHSIDPKEVIDFIEKNFELSQKTGGIFIEKSEQKMQEA
jgi:ribulose-5-phosphate 4-epimerase/fuculose-1-phosphate aldolase